ncbi:helicase associated domain-containing protein [Streptomyces phaeoluteigriseus]|uniref:helicase associated domain-containing protein n=1 Tax=Streptomyces phaeoluteigriseus TaxID=114686 RepID=UPI003EB8C88D
MSLLVIWVCVRQQPQPTVTDKQGRPAVRACLFHEEPGATTPACTRTGAHVTVRRHGRSPAATTSSGPAAAQYKARTGSVTVPRSRGKHLADGTEVKLGVWLTRTKTTRAKLTTEQLAALAGLGLDWAAV